MLTDISLFFQYKMRESVFYVDMPKMILSTMAIVHAIIAIGFGFGLYVSVGSNVSPTYVYLGKAPGWPISVGTIYILLGVALMYSRFRKNDKYVISSISFFLLSIVSFFYGTLFLFGSIETNSIIGPQLLYLGFSTLHLLHAIHSLVEWLQCSKGGTDDEFFDIVRDIS